MNSEKTFWFYLKRIVVTLIFTLCIVIIFSSHVNAQTDAVAGKKWYERLYTGGDLGFQFGTNTVIDIAPLIGYRITDRFSAGLGATYIYYSIKDYYGGTYTTNIYGGSVFARYYFLENLFGHTEFQVLNYEVPYSYYTTVRKNVTYIFVGGGYAQQIGANSQIVLMLLYNLNEDQNSLYRNPIVRVGFNIGL